MAGLSSDLAGIIARRVEVHLINGQIVAAHEVIDNAWAEHQTPRADLTSQEILDLSLAEIGLPIRIANALESVGVERLGRLLACRRDELTEVDNLGESTLREIVEVARGWEAQYQAAVERENRRPTPAGMLAGSGDGNAREQVESSRQTKPDRVRKTVHNH